MFCRCPKCNKLQQVKSQEFGKSFSCNNCHHKVILDIIHLAHFSLPKEIHLQLVGKNNLPLKLSGVAIFADYGYRVGPNFTDKDGKTVFTKFSFEKAEKEEIMSGLMDHKGDYSLSRYLTILVPSKQVSATIDLEKAECALHRLAI